MHQFIMRPEFEYVAILWIRTCVTHTICFYDERNMKEWSIMENIDKPLVHARAHLDTNRRCVVVRISYVHHIPCVRLCARYVEWVASIWNTTKWRCKTMPTKCRPNADQILTFDAGTFNMWFFFQLSSVYGLKCIGEVKFDGSFCMSPPVSTLTIPFPPSSSSMDGCCND